MLARRPKSVDFPAPLGPRRTVAPAANPKEKFSSTGVREYPNVQSDTTSSSANGSPHFGARAEGHRGAFVVEVRVLPEARIES